MQQRPLKLEIEENGSQQKFLQVYPKVVHYAETAKTHYWFTLIKAHSEAQANQGEFILRGIWQKVGHCPRYPVITILRNIDMLHHFKRISRPGAKKAFARPQDFPVVWESPVEPFLYNPNLGKDEQMPRYFVQIRAVFKCGQFHVTEILEESTLDIPKYIKPNSKKSIIT